MFSGTFKLLYAVKIFLILLGSLFVLFTSLEQLKRFKDLRKLAWLRFLISFGIAGFVAYILNLFIGGFIFWVLIVVVIIFNIFFSQFKVLKVLRRK